MSLPSPASLPAAGLTTDQLEQGTSLWSDAWHRLRKNKLAVTGGVLLIVLVGACFLLPLLFDLSYEAQGLSIGGLPPGSKVVKISEITPKRALEVSNLENLSSSRVFGEDAAAKPLLSQLANGHDVVFEGRRYHPSVYLLGADAPLGRDLFARILYGGRISITVGVVATVVALLIGVAFGAVAGFFGGKLDSVMMRIVDILYALPFTIFVILLMVLFGRNIILMFLAIGAVEWLTMARIVRGQIMSIKKMEYIEAARSLGLSHRRIIFRHMVPNVLGPVLVYTSLTIPSVMMLEAFISFLGLGVQPPLSSWGVLIKDGAEKMEEFWWLLVFPGAAFSLTLFSLNFLGDGLRDALDVRTAKD